MGSGMVYNELEVELFMQKNLLSSGTDRNPIEVEHDYEKENFHN